MRLAWLLLALVPALAAADRYPPGGPADPYLGSARQLADDARHHSALVELLRIPASGREDADTAAYRLQLAESYLRYGLPAEAERLFPQLARSEPDTYAQLQLDVAAYHYERGGLQQAAAALDALRPTLPKALLPRWLDLRSRVHLALEEYPQAIEHLQALERGDGQSPYARFNLGVALIRNGQPAAGREWLDRLGRMRSTSLEEAALRDKANLALGWHYLNEDLGSQAREAFERIRVSGPFANRALLGLGWAELASQRAPRNPLQPSTGPTASLSNLGALLKPDFFQREQERRRQRAAALVPGTLPPAQQAAFSRALTAWSELIERDPVDPAVQEASLAVAYALDQLGAGAQATVYYQRAVDELERNRQRMDAAMASIRNGRMLETIARRSADNEAGRAWKLTELPDAPETYYLQGLLAEHRFQEALKNYRDTRHLLRRVQDWQQRLEQLRQWDPERDARAEDELASLLARVRTSRPAPAWRLDTPLKLQTQLLRAPAQSLPAHTPLHLRPVAVPARFSGPLQTLGELQPRLQSLREELDTAHRLQGRLLEQVSLDELARQKTQVEQYLVEARFALARLHDRQTRSRE